MTYMDLDLETKEYISELTDKIREKYNIKTPIQDMTEIVKQIGIDTNNIIQPVFAKSKSDMKLIIKFANALKTMSKTQKQELAKHLDNTV